MTGRKAIQDTHVLVVDDETSTRQELVDLLKRMGYQVSTADNRYEAFALFKDHSFNVIISDIDVPGEESMKVLERARATQPGLPVILLVSEGSELKTEEALSKGADAIFGKPLDKKVLIEAMQRFLLPADERWYRLSDRVAIDLNVEVNFPTAQRPTSTKVTNISRGGMYVAMGSQLPEVSDSVTFKLDWIEANVRLYGSGVVRWVRTQDNPPFVAGCGIEFTYLGEEEKKKIVEYIQLQNPKA